ncbi:hypothetical protein ROHU_028502 [Labeo rohita]|uniref:Uncharacterized protein n=1 Tax=Labeo rohita TaxID=84645 RepID=A0A498MCS4_LABRO|nr:hypothetical protein ROHU_028502 [Labeo rohita]
MRLTMAKYTPFCPFYLNAESYSTADWDVSSLSVPAHRNQVVARRYFQPKVFRCIRRKYNWSDQRYIKRNPCGNCKGFKLFVCFFWLGFIAVRAGNYERERQKTTSRITRRLSNLTAKLHAAGNPRQTFTDDGSEGLREKIRSRGGGRTPKGPDPEKHAAGGLTACH